MVRRHRRSVSHGEGATLVTNNTGNIVPRSALKSSKGHKRAFSHGQILDAAGLPAHSHVEWKTDFILPPEHKETHTALGGTPKPVRKGRSRQPSGSDSNYTLRRAESPSIWRKILNLVLRRTPEREDERLHPIVVPNHTVPPKTPKKDHPNGARSNNKIRTRKYTLLTFLPKNLFEQFHRIANLYFIFIVLLNWVPEINAFGREVAMIPVLFVLGVTAIKDVFEDRRRYTTDKRINNLTCRIYQR
ncbi:Phospholipid-translocating ATPase N-terminal [Popillia japonica]